MKTINLRIVAAALGVLVLAAAAPAAVPEEGWRLRVNGYWMDANEGRVNPRNTEFRTQVEESTSVGGSIAGEYRFGPRLGLELGILGGADNDYIVVFDDGMLAANDTLAFDAACVGLNFHLTPGKKADLYAGPLLAYVTYSDMSLGFTVAPPGSPSMLVPVSVRFGDEVALGANLGVDIPITQRHWLFNIDIKYLAASPSTTLRGMSAVPSRDRAGIDPLMMGLGLGYRF